MPIYDISPTWRNEVQNKARGGVPTCDDSSISSDLVAWNQIKTLLQKSQNNGTAFSNAIVSTYSLVYTAINAYLGGVLAPNGDIHFVPLTANRGQKIDINGVVSTYSLIYTASTAYASGVLAPNGDIHFVPFNANRGQEISTLPAKPLNIGVCCSPFLNKF